MLTMPKKQDSRNSRPSQRRQHGGCRKTEKQKGAFGDALLSCLCGVQPRVVDFDPPLCSPEEFRAMHYRKHVKGQQIQKIMPVHWLHPRAIMIATLYDCIVTCPGAPKRLLECLVFHKSLIRYEDYPPRSGSIPVSYSEEEEEVESPETHACEEPSSSSCRAQTEEASAGAATIHGAMTEGEEAAIIDSELLQEEDIDSASQAAERLESIGDAACCLNDTFEEDELEAAGLCSEMDQHEADLAAINKILGSPFVQRDAMRMSEAEEYKMSASPVRHGIRQPVIKITANSATSSSPVARALFQLESQEERRQRFKDGRHRDASCAKAASSAASAAADSAAAAAAAATVNAASDKTSEMNALLDTMSTETGERCAQAAQKTALETVIEDTEAELAKLQRSKVASMIALYQGMDSPERASPKISARHTPVSRKKLADPLLPPRKADDSFTESVSRKSDTSRYLNAVQAATNTVSSWLQKGNPLADSMQSIPSPVAAAAVQLHDERPIRNTAEDMRPLTPPVKRSMENLTFSTPSAHLYEDNEHSLWSSSFTSDRAACEVNPEKAAKHAAAAARKALEAAQHAHRAAMYAGLLPKGAHEAEPWRNAGRYLDTATTDSQMVSFQNLLFEPTSF